MERNSWFILADRIHQPYMVMKTAMLRTKLELKTIIKWVVFHVSCKMC